MDLSNFESLVNKHLSAIKFPTSPKNLYEPIEYFISIGGKRVRPIASLITFSLFKEINADIINASLAIEIFHNFTLANDDIMDDSRYRRGKDTINKKWNNNIAILSGDALLIKSYHFLNKISSEKKDDIINFFNEIALKVCEGQQMDMDFETKNDVTIDNYLLMIELKTAVLFAASLKVAAILSGASNNDIDSLYISDRWNTTFRGHSRRPRRRKGVCRSMVNASKSKMLWEINGRCTNSNQSVFELPQNYTTAIALCQARAK